MQRTLANDAYRQREGSDNEQKNIYVHLFDDFGRVGVFFSITGGSTAG